MYDHRYPQCMSLLGNQVLSALVGLVFVFGLLYLMPGYWIRGVLVIAAVAFILSSLAQHRDYHRSVLILAASELTVLTGISIFWTWTGYRANWLMKLFIAALAFTSLWIWLQRGAPSKILVIPTVMVVASVWIYALIAAPVGDGNEDGDGFVHVDSTPIATLIKRDTAFLRALYDATNGRPGIFVGSWELREVVNLTIQQADVAADRLMHTGQIEWDEGSGYALKRKGVEAIERLYREKKRRPSVTNTFNFHGNASGVFGSRNKVQGSSFHSGTPELVQDMLSAAADLRRQVTPAVACEIDEAGDEVRLAGNDKSRLRSAARRMAQIAAAVGEVGAPLLRMTDEVLKVVG